MARPLLFEPLTIRSITLKNRIMASPMCQYRSIDGAPSAWHMAHMGRLAIGGAGLIFYEETAVEARGRKTHSCAGLWDRRHVTCLRQITNLIEDIGAVPAIQLGHAGGQAATHDATRDWAPLTSLDCVNGLPPWRPISASAIAMGAGQQICQEMSLTDIRDVICAFSVAAQRAVEAGFRVIEVHGAHGYLIHQFLSPVTNWRTDSYGGDLHGRMRLALEIGTAVREAIPAGTPLFYRLSCRDGQGGIWDLNDTVVLADALGQRGIDVIDCSSGGISGSSPMPRIPRTPGYQVQYSKRVRKETGLMTVAVGLITEPQQAEDILTSGGADLIALARGLLECSEWPFWAARELGLSDPFDILPVAYAFRLRRRHEQSQMPFNKQGID